MLLSAVINSLISDSDQRRSCGVYAARVTPFGHPPNLHAQVLLFCAVVVGTAVFFCSTTVSGAGLLQTQSCVVVPLWFS